MGHQMEKEDGFIEKGKYTEVKQQMGKLMEKGDFTKRMELIMKVNGYMISKKVMEKSNHQKALSIKVNIDQV